MTNEGNRGSFGRERQPQKLATTNHGQNLTANQLILEVGYVTGVTLEGSGLENLNTCHGSPGQNWGEPGSNRLNLWKLRLKPDAQKETRDVAHMMLSLVKELPGSPFRMTMEAFGIQ